MIRVLLSLHVTHTQQCPEQVRKTERTLCCADDVQAPANARAAGKRKSGKKGRGEERVHFQLRDKRLQSTPEEAVAASQISAAHAQLAAMFTPAISKEIIAAVVAQHGGDVGACADALLAMSATNGPGMSGSDVASTSTAAAGGGQRAQSLWDMLPEDCKFLVTCKLSSREVAGMARASSDMLRFAQMRRGLFTALHVKAPLKQVGAFVACHPNAAKVRTALWNACGVCA